MNCKSKRGKGESLTKSPIQNIMSVLHEEIKTGVVKFPHSLLRATNSKSWS